MIRCIALFLFLTSFSLFGKTLEDVIEKARDYVGPGDKLEAVETLLYEGVLTPADGSAARTVRLVLQKPAKQMLEITQNDGQITMIVNSLEGFSIQKNLTNGRTQILPLPTDQVRRFKANAAENLYFFEFPTNFRVRAKYLGETQFRGQTVDEVRFLHPGSIQFTRYFNPETGELVGTLTDVGLVNTEEGSMKVDGLNFSAKVLTLQGDTLLHTIEFNNIEVNPELPADTFTAPQ